MKKPKLFLLLLLALCMTHTNVLAQNSDSSDDISVYLEGAVPEVDGVPGLTKDVIYERVQNWMEKRLAENANDRSRVVYKDADGGVIAGAAEEWLVFKSNALSLDRAWMGYNIKVECGNEYCKVRIEKIRYTYQDVEKYVAEEIITDKNALNKSKTKMIIGFKKWRVKTVDFASDMFDAVAKAISTSAEQAAAEKAAAEAALQSKKSKKVVINTGTQTNIGATTVDPEMNMEVVKSIQPRPVVVATDAAEKSTQAVAAVPTTNTSDLKEIAPESVGKDAIKFGEGKLVIVIGEGDVFNMSIITANAGGSIGSVNNRPVVFSILSPDQSYDAVEKAEVYNVKYYPDGTTTPSLVLECKKVQGPAAFDGQPRTYIGEITKAWTK
jgi:hypothetical protein